MPATDYKNWHPSGEDVQFAEKSVCRYLEILKYPGNESEEPMQQEGELDDLSLKDWCERDLRESSSFTPAKEVYPSGWRIIFELPDAFLRLLPTFEQRAIKYHNRHEKSELEGLLLKSGFYRSDFYQIAVTHNKKNSLSHCLIISKDPPFEESQLFKNLKSQLAQSNQFFLPAMIASELEIESCHQRLINSDIKLNDLEESMGQHEYNDRPSGNPLEMDFLSTTRSLNHISKRVAVVAGMLGYLIITLETIQTVICRDPVQLKLYESKMEFMRDSCRTLLLSAEYEKRTKMLVQAVYQFMAQKDSKANIALAQNSAVMAKASTEDSAVMRTIAVETKRDSSSMKTIAVLGMFFLPGTFIAAIFAMPVVEWDNNGKPVVKMGFKYYWAVTVPLTALVLLTWSLAMFLPWRSWLGKFTKSAAFAEHLDE